VLCQALTAFEFFCSGEAEMAVRQHDRKTEAEELSKTLAAQLDIKDLNITALRESNKAKVHPSFPPPLCVVCVRRVACHWSCFTCRQIVTN
jgi:hypothetical protein